MKLQELFNLNKLRALDKKMFEFTIFELKYLDCHSAKWLFQMLQGIVAAGLTQYRAYSTDEVTF